MALLNLRIRWYGVFQSIGATPACPLTSIFNDVTMNMFLGGLRFLGRWSQIVDSISEPSYTNCRDMLSLQNTKIQNVFFTPEHGRKHQFVDNQG